MKATDRPLVRLQWQDFAIAFFLAAVYLAALIVTAPDLGYARDEGFYFTAAQSYEAWFEILREEPARALEPQVIDRYWGVIHEHPGLIKSLFALSHHDLYSGLGWFKEQGTAYRFAAMALSALALSTIYLWGRLSISRLSGLVAALSFGLMPRVFFHSHLACFDLPVTSLWLLTAFVYFRSFEKGRWGFVLGSGILYGLLLNTKHNAWLLPGALLLHLGLLHLSELWQSLKQRKLSIPGGLSIPGALYAMALLGPLVFYATWPWIWHDPWTRLRDYVNFHLHHDYYNMEFLGNTYWKPPMPRAYPWVMTAATVPGITLLLALLGIGCGLRVAIRLKEAPSPERSQRWNADALWLACLFISYAPWLSSQTPIFGGTKHWLTAYPFLCLFAGRGFQVLVDRLIELWHAQSPAVARAAPVLTTCSVLAGPAVMTAHAYPWGLSFYTPLFGGAPGAATLGLNRTFWGYTTGAVQEFLNRTASARGRIYVHDTALQSWQMLVEDGRVRQDLFGTLDIAASDLALYHHEPHMGRVEYEIWVNYARLAPVHLADYDGVPVIWVYRRGPDGP